MQKKILNTALSDRPRIFQIITICLFSLFVSIIVVYLLAATQKGKSDDSKPQATYASQTKTKAAVIK